MVNSTEPTSQESIKKDTKQVNEQELTQDKVTNKSLAFTQFALVELENNEFEIYVSEASLKNNHPELEFKSCKVEGKLVRLIKRGFDLIEPTIYLKVTTISNAVNFEFSSEEKKGFIPVGVKASPAP